MPTTYEYIDQLLAEMPENQTLHDVVKNILDKPIPETVKRCLLKPLHLRKISAYPYHSTKQNQGVEKEKEDPVGRIWH